jgi:hypothetical protein
MKPLAATASGRRREKEVEQSWFFAARRATEDYATGHSAEGFCLPKSSHVVPEETKWWRDYTSPDMLPGGHRR